jgi:hypothetical protein
MRTPTIAAALLAAIASGCAEAPLPGMETCRSDDPVRVYCAEYEVITCHTQPCGLFRRRRGVCGCTMRTLMPDAGVEASATTRAIR